ncbi:helix-turn-helix domain-containing protein (plasmid) [Streptomyces clavifer]|uniref:helix-turn-helix transcriptional regulator n=1 Tax=Streptomyces clavifer TaxID=68188 RepID=UPI002E81D9B1|nr:helix-turn-helix transcriptional regulator [Streptomyces clavifer]WUC32717.1 helix-turn-helix domain-containing protein [Streptomyces clavifer]
MGRRENDVDQTVPARAVLAQYLRERRRAAGLTYSQMSEAVGGRISKATFERAASGSTVPSWDTVEWFIVVTSVKKGLLAINANFHSRELWVRARRATRAPYYVHQAPDPALVSCTAGFLRALRHQHVWAGYPTPGEMELTAGPGVLPKTTTRRIIAGDVLPVDPEQAVAFLRACYVESAALEQWLAAAVRALRDDPSRSKRLDRWVKAHQEMTRQLQENGIASVTPLRAREEQHAA